MKKVNMNKANINNDKGVALIQILIIVAILSLVALYVTKSARHQLTMARWAVDKSEAAVLLHSTQNKILFELLTTKWLPTRNSQNPTTNKWNFHNEPFEVSDGAYVKIQDQAGLINLHFPIVGIIKKRLAYEKLPPELIAKTEATLLDWQDNDRILRPYGNESNVNIRNGIMPDVREWLLHNTLSKEQFLAIAPDFTVHGDGHLNLLNSPLSIITSLTNQAVAHQIDNLRKNRQLTRDNIRKITGISQGDDFFYSTSTNQKISILINSGEASLEKIIIVELSPYSVRQQKPYNIMQTEGG